MTCQDILTELVREFDSWPCKNHVLQERDRAYLDRMEFLSRHPYHEHSSRIAHLSSQDVYNPGPGRDYFFRWMVYKLSPLGGLGDVFPRPFREAASRIGKFRRLLEVAVDNTKTLANRIDGDWGEIPGFGRDRQKSFRQLAKKIVATYYPEETMPIFNQKHMEHFADRLRLDREALAAKKYGKGYDLLLAGQRWELLTEALLDSKTHHEVLRTEDNVFFMYVLYSGSLRPHGMGEWVCNGNGKRPPARPSPPEAIVEYDPVAAVIELQTGIKKGQRFCASAEARGAIERQAMRRATQYLEADGWRVRDVSRENRGYDLHCNRRGEVVMVEVKGTTGDASKVLLTPNEVSHARARHPKVGLIVVSEISLSPDSAEEIGANDGEVREIRPWVLNDGVLMPVGYEYRLPSKPK